MARYRTINVDLNRQYRNDLNANFAQIEQDILGQENLTVEMKESLLTELARIEQESIDRDNTLAKQNLEVLLQSIEDAKANANTSASNANTKANYAQTQGNYAKEQGDYAKDQGDYALTKGNYADEKAILADQAAANASTEASNLSQLKVEVVTATQNANSASDTANNSATNADEKAQYAQEQGDYAKQQADRAQDIVDGTGLLTQTDIGELVAGFNASGQVLDKNGNVVEGKVKSVNNTQPDLDGNIDISIPSKTSDLTNDTGFLTNVTKSTIGLGSVQNYGVATQAEAEAGTSSSKYMTPQRTAQAIVKLAPLPKASQITIDDVSNLFTSADVEGALSELFTNVSNGKNQIATAITDKDVNASGSDSFSTLASKIRQISGGKKWAIGTVTTNPINIATLEFTPSKVIITSRDNGGYHIKTIIISNTADFLFKENTLVRSIAAGHFGNRSSGEYRNYETSAYIQTNGFYADTGFLNEANWFAYE